MDTTRKSITWSRVVIVFAVLVLLSAIQTLLYPELFIFWSLVLVLSACVLAAQSRHAKIASAVLLFMALAATLYATAKSPLFPFRTRIPATHYESVPLPAVLQDLAKKKGRHPGLRFKLYGDALTNATVTMDVLEGQTIGDVFRRIMDDLNCTYATRGSQNCSGQPDGAWVWVLIWRRERARPSQSGEKPTLYIYSDAFIQAKTENGNK
jgi:hypothetical protein